MNNPLKDLKKPVNVNFDGCDNGCTDEPRLVIEIPKDEDCIYILGHRLDTGHKSFEEFCEYLGKLAELQDENEKLIKELNEMKIDRGNFITYLEEKVEEAKLLRVYDHELKGHWVSKEEQIYQQILDKYCKKEESE